MVGFLLPNTLSFSQKQTPASAGRLLGFDDSFDDCVVVDVNQTL